MHTWPRQPSQPGLQLWHHWIATSTPSKAWLASPHDHPINSQIAAWTSRGRLMTKDQVSKGESPAKVDKPVRYLEAWREANRATGRSEAALDAAQAAAAAAEATAEATLATERIAAAALAAATVARSAAQDAAESAARTAALASSDETAAEKDLEATSAADEEARLRFHAAEKAARSRIGDPSWPLGLPFRKGGPLRPVMASFRRSATRGPPPGPDPFPRRSRQT
jgi:hypothetical protein